MANSYLAQRIFSRALRSTRSLQQNARFCSSEVVTERPVWTPPTEEELANEPDPFLRKEIKEYARARIKLAQMMGKDPKMFSDQDVKEAIQYLFPTSLTMKDARPFLKHPSEIYPAPIESAFGHDSRPLESAFYMRTPAYYNLIYEIYEQTKILEEAELSNEKGHPETSDTVSQSMLNTQDQEFVADSSAAESSQPPMLESDQNVGKEELECQSEFDLLTDVVDSNTVTSEDALSMTEEADAVANGDLDVESGEQPFLEEAVQESDAAWSILAQTQPKKWISKEALATMLSERITDKKYEDVIDRLKSLSHHPQSHLVAQFLDRFRKPVHSPLSQIQKISVSDKGVARAHGWRKTSVADVWVKAGSGQFTVNKRLLIEYFPRVQDRNQVLYPLMVTDLLGKFDVQATVKGGGLTGQAGAIRLGLSKALASFPGPHSFVLESEGLLVRDPRMVERKKPGQLKARKKFAWVKR